MQTLHPEVRVFEHLPLRETHERVDVAADEGAFVIARGLIGVHDPGSHRKQVLQPPARLLQFGGALFDPLLQVVVGLLEGVLLPLAFAQVSGETDCADLLALLVDQNRRRKIRTGMLLSSLALSTLSNPDTVPPRLRHLAQDFICPRLASVEHAQGSADGLLGSVTEQRLRSVVEQDDFPILVGGDDGVGRALDQAGERLLGLLELGVGGERVCFRLLDPGDVGPGADQLQGIAGVVAERPEGVLDPDIVPVPVPEPVLDGAVTSFDQGGQFVEHSGGVLGVQPVGPALRIWCSEASCHSSG